MKRSRANSGQRLCKSGEMCVNMVKNKNNKRGQSATALSGANCLRNGI
jgi:hypothetical protein